MIVPSGCSDRSLVRCVLRVALSHSLGRAGWLRQARARPRAVGDAVEVAHDGGKLFSWLRRRREQAVRAEVEAAALLAADRATAVSEARQRQQDGQDADVFAHWDRVMRSVARLTGRQIGPDTATRVADEPDMSAPEPDPIEKLERILGRDKCGRS